MSHTPIEGAAPPLRFFFKFKTNEDSARAREALDAAGIHYRQPESTRHRSLLVLSPVDDESPTRNRKVWEIAKATAADVLVIDPVTNRPKR